MKLSEKVLLHNEEAYRMNTVHGDLPDKAVLTIENTNLTAAEVARMIEKHYHL
jgi:RIO-like serine/threonine protein kinase